MPFAKKLKQIRLNHRLTQQDMGRRLQVSQPVYYRYEPGEKTPHGEDSILQRISNEFGVSAEWLISEDNNYSFCQWEHCTSDAAKGFINTNNNNYYTVPKDFIDVFVKQQTILEKLILLLKDRTN